MICKAFLPGYLCAFSETRVRFPSPAPLHFHALTTQCIKECSKVNGFFAFCLLSVLKGFLRLNRGRPTKAPLPRALSLPSLPRLIRTGEELRAFACPRERFAERSLRYLFRPRWAPDLRGNCSSPSFRRDPDGAQVEAGANDRDAEIGLIVLASGEAGVVEEEPGFAPALRALEVHAFPGLRVGTL